jgi:hypothetical protein
MMLQKIFNQGASYRDRVVMVEITSGTEQVLEDLPAHFYIDGSLAYGDLDDAMPRAFYFEEKNGAVF